MELLWMFTFIVFFFYAHTDLFSPPGLLSLSVCVIMSSSQESILYSQINMCDAFNCQHLSNMCHCNVMITSQKERMQKEIILRHVVSVSVGKCLLTVWVVAALGVLVPSLTRDSSVAQLSSHMKHGFPNGASRNSNSWSNPTKSRLLHIQHGWHLSDFTIGIVFP